MVGVRAKDHDNKRRLILDTAASLFARQGFTKTSISEISTACHASKAWIYHYFPTKEDILFTLLHEFLSVVEARVDRAVGEADASEALQRFVLESLRIYDDYRINYPVLFNEMIFLRDDQQRELRAIEAKPVRRLEAVLAKLRPELGAANALRSPVTLLVYGAINSTYTWFDPDKKLSTEQLAALIVDFVRHGLDKMRLQGPA